MSLTSFQTIRGLCQKHLAGWAKRSAADISIEELHVATSNRNFRVCLQQDHGRTCVLFRALTPSQLYDPQFERKIFNMLSAYGIAPQLHASGENWRIEEWFNSVPLANGRMRNPSIMAQVAAQFGRLHKLSQRSDFPREVLASGITSVERLSKWGDQCIRIEESSSVVSTSNLDLDMDEIMEERSWLKDYMVENDPRLPGSGLDVVFSHVDGQENNILETQSGLRFIDFEYSGMDYQAFDLASYFVECMIDYTHNSPPFYLVRLGNYPTVAEQRFFLSIYLSEYLDRSVHPEDEIVQTLQQRTQRFVLVSHLFWTYWSIIRHAHAANPNFNYAKYAECRWRLYKRAKHEFLHTKVNGHMHESLGFREHLEAQKSL
mmetsp:Transcript_49560/g.91414  ORF Transcript_49560/g.91414 Transcript_49560/m.91414 type:complete len:375 (-) Transcript_49560:49-1173(-)